MMHAVPQVAKWAIKRAVAIDAATGDLAACSALLQAVAAASL